MKHLLSKILISIIVLGGILLFGADVFAQSAEPLVVQFEKTPLFSEVNFLPGDTISRWIKVYNYTGQTLGISVAAIKVDDPDGLGSVLPFQIKQGANILYDGTLASFFAAGEVYLSDLDNGSQAQYDFYVTFDANSGDEYAGKILGFDFNIISSGGETTLMTMTTFEGGGGGVGGDGGENPTTLLIENSDGIGGNENFEQTGEVLGSAIIRTVLPETGGLMGRISRKIGLSTKGLFDYEINILFGGIFVLVMIGLVVVRKFILR